MHWSKTRHVSYRKCPRQFFYANVAAPMNPKIAALAGRESAHLLRHSVVRDILLGLVEAGEADAVDVEGCLKDAHVILAKSLENDLDVKAQLTIVKQCLVAFVSAELAEIRKTTRLYTSTGNPVEFSYDGLSIMAAPELVLDRGKAVEILSFKTGSSSFREARESLLHAAGLTAWGRSVLGCLDRPIVVTEIFLREDCLRIDQCLSDHEMREFVRDARATAAEYSASAKIRDFPARPDVKRCRFCDFTSACPEWQEFAERDYDLAALRQKAAEGGKEPKPPEVLRDLFLCHVGREKETTVYPLARALESAGISYWLDEAEILLGDHIVLKINSGLRSSRFVLCFFSKAFIDQGWPEGEMESALSIEFAKREPRVLPVIVGDSTPILDAYPLLAGKRHAKWSDGLHRLVEDIKRLLKREK